MRCLDSSHGYHPEAWGARTFLTDRNAQEFISRPPGGIRTPDTLVRNQMLYPT